MGAVLAPPPSPFGEWFPNFSVISFAGGDNGQPAQQCGKSLVQDTDVASAAPGSRSFPYTEPNPFSSQEITTIRRISSPAVFLIRQIFRHLRSTLYMNLRRVPYLIHKEKLG